MDNRIFVLTIGAGDSRYGDWSIPRGGQCLMYFRVYQRLKGTYGTVARGLHKLTVF